MKKKFKKQKINRNLDEEMGKIHKVKPHSKNEKYRHPKHWLEEEEEIMDLEVNKIFGAEEE